jgi:hypothetical protein
MRGEVDIAGRQDGRGPARPARAHRSSEPSAYLDTISPTANRCSYASDRRPKPAEASSGKSVNPSSLNGPLPASASALPAPAGGAVPQ